VNFDGAFAIAVVVVVVVVVDDERFTAVVVVVVVVVVVQRGSVNCMLSYKYVGERMRVDTQSCES